MKKAAYKLIFPFQEFRKSSGFSEKCGSDTSRKSKFDRPVHRRSNPEVWIASIAGVDTLGKF